MKRKKGLRDAEALERCFSRTARDKGPVDNRSTTGRSSSSAGPSTLKVTVSARIRHFGVPTSWDRADRVPHRRDRRGLILAASGGYLRSMASDHELSVPVLTRRRAVDFARVATCLCR